LGVLCVGGFPRNRRAIFSQDVTGAKRAAGFRERENKKMRRFVKTGASSLSKKESHTFFGGMFSK